MKGLWVWILLGMLGAAVWTRAQRPGWKVHRTGGTSFGKGLDHRLQKTCVREMDKNLRKYLKRTGPALKRLVDYMKYYSRATMLSRWNYYSNWIDWQAKKVRRRPGPRLLFQKTRQLCSKKSWDSFWNLVRRVDKAHGNVELSRERKIFLSKWP